MRSPSPTGKSIKRKDDYDSDSSEDHREFEPTNNSHIVLANLHYLVFIFGLITHRSFGNAIWWMQGILYWNDSDEKPLLASDNDRWWCKIAGRFAILFSGCALFAALL